MDFRAVHDIIIDGDFSRADCPDPLDDVRSFLQHHDSPRLDVVQGVFFLDPVVGIGHDSDRMQADTIFRAQLEILLRGGFSAIQRFRGDLSRRFIVNGDQNIECAAGKCAQVRHGEAQVQRAADETVVVGHKPAFRRGKDKLLGGTFHRGHSQVDHFVGRDEPDGPNGFQFAFLIRIIVRAVPGHPALYVAVVENDLLCFGVVSVAGHDVSFDHDQDRTPRVDLPHVVLEREVSPDGIDIMGSGDLHVQGIAFILNIKVKSVLVILISRLDRPLDSGILVGDRFGILVVQILFQHGVDPIIRHEHLVGAPPELAGAEIVCQAVPVVGPDLRPRALVYERVRQFFRGSGRRGFVRGFDDDVEGVVGEEPVYEILRGSGLAENGIEIVHDVYLVSRSARVQLHVAFDQGGEILAAVAVQVVIPEEHGDRRGAASVHVSCPRKGVRKPDVAVGVHDCGRLDRDGQDIVGHAQRVGGRSDVGRLPDLECAEFRAGGVHNRDGSVEASRAAREVV